MPPTTPSADQRRVLFFGTIPAGPPLPSRSTPYLIPACPQPDDAPMNPVRSSSQITYAVNTVNIHTFPPSPPHLSTSVATNVDDGSDSHSLSASSCPRGSLTDYDEEQDDNDSYEIVSNSSLNVTSSNASLQDEVEAIPRTTSQPQRGCAYIPNQSTAVVATGTKAHNARRSPMAHASLPRGRRWFIVEVEYPAILALVALIPPDLVVHSLLSPMGMDLAEVKDAWWLEDEPTIQIVFFSKHTMWDFVAQMRDYRIGDIHTCVLIDEE